MKIPGPDRPISIAPNAGRVLVRAGGRIIADSRHAVTLMEANYPPVQYLPRADTALSELVPSEHTTTCPFKGEASYYGIRTADGGLIENAVWTYRTPYDTVAEIEGLLAFYPMLVDSIEVLSE
jgi:uncharacterized protein (DUF427 family)